MKRLSPTKPPISVKAALSGKIKPFDSVRQEEMWRLAFSLKLSKIMEENDLTQIELSRVTGYHQTTISKYLKGQRAPEVTFLQKLAHHLSKPIGWLLDQDFDFELRGVTRRLNLALERLEVGAREVAAVLKVTEARVKALQDGAAPGTAELDALRMTYGVDPWWILTGQGDMLPGQPAPPINVPNERKVAETGENQLTSDLNRVMDRIRTLSQDDPRFIAWLDYTLDHFAKT